MAQELVISVLTRDRVGLIAGVSQAVHAAHGNIGAISQTVLQGYFTIILAATLPDECVPEQLQRAIEATGRAGELAVLVCQRSPAGAVPPVVPAGDKFVLTMSSLDQPGILARVTAYLASHGINIEDLTAQTEQGCFLVMGEVMLPAAEDVRQMQIDLAALLPEQAVQVTLQHANIFAATNEVAFRHAKRSMP